MALNLVMCDKKCMYQEDGYCKVENCKPGNITEECPYFEAEKSKITEEFPQKEIIQEIPTLKPDLPIIQPQKPL